VPTQRRPSQVFGQRLRAARQHRGLTQAELAARMKEVGRPISKTAIIRIERGEGARGLELDLALAFAAALAAAPATLLTPDRGVEVALTDEHVTDADRMRAWLTLGTLTRTEGEEGFLMGVPSDPRRERFEREIGRRAERIVDAYRAEDTTGVRDIVLALVEDVHKHEEETRKLKERAEEYGHGRKL
jgi:transcriptional regulator with XRE-family HTH domain